MAKKIKRKIMTLEVTLGGKEFTFKTPQAEDILAQIKAIEKRSAGIDMVHFENQETGKLEYYTFCCGEHCAVSFTTDEVTLKETEVDCYGFPITYYPPEEDGSIRIELHPVNEGGFAPIFPIPGAAIDHTATGNNNANVSVDNG
ncbi:MAG: hypothetical protein PUG13_01280 [Streptococcus hyointestinalis]|nr:hypothetical protein [Streptococcus hyointestinalis]MDD6384037.1 hypothetical protein [Streptococcus hyointestinalis]